MQKNLGTLDRFARLFAAVALIGAAVWAPWPDMLRYAVLIPNAVYLFFTALAGTCLGYRMRGLSTCPAQSAT